MARLNNKYFTGKKNSGTGEVDAQTIFYYKQCGNHISADYSGGEIISGHLLGTIEGDKLDFVYHHINNENIVRTGKCNSIIVINDSGRMELNEIWQWTNGDLSSGESTVIEIDFSEINAKSYNSSARNYHKKFNDYDIYKKHSGKFARYLRDGDTILDLGCGSGINSKIFSEHGLIVTGVDISVGMIELAEVNCPEGTFLTDDIRTFKTDERFDAVAAAFCIVHLNSAESSDFLKRISGFMHDGSYLYLSFMEGSGDGFEKTSFSDKPIYFNYYNSELLIKELEKGGFSLVEINIEDYAEENGSITKDVFMILKFNVK